MFKGLMEVGCLSVLGFATWILVRVGSFVMLGRLYGFLSLHAGHELYRS